MTSFNVNKTHFFRRIFYAFFSGSNIFFILIIVVASIMFCLSDYEMNVRFILLISPIVLWLILWSLFFSYKYLYRIEINCDKVSFYYLVFNTTKIVVKDVGNTKVYFNINLKSRSYISFGEKIKGYTYKESFCQYFICDWGNQYKDFAKFLNDNGIWNNYREPIIKP